MGLTTSISDYELERATTRGPEADGYAPEAGSGGKKAPVTTSKVVEVEDKKPPAKKTTARTKAK